MKGIKTISASRKAGSQPKTTKNGKVHKPRSSAKRPPFSKILD